MSTQTDHTNLYAMYASFKAARGHRRVDPTQAAGGVSLVDGQLRTLPAEGVESNAAADARADQADHAARSVEAMTAGEAPKRRGASKS